MRSAVIVLDKDRVALIERVRNGHTYYVFPGGTIEENETPPAAAIREAYEEPGVHVMLDRLAAVITFRNQDQYYYHARISAGVFGSGTGEELSSDPTTARGSYRPLWLAREELTAYEIRPQALAQLLAAGTLSSMQQPLRMEETQ